MAAAAAAAGAGAAHVGHKRPRSPSPTATAVAMWPDDATYKARQEALARVEQCTAWPCDDDEDYGWLMDFEESKGADIEQETLCRFLRRTILCWRYNQKREAPPDYAALADVFALVKAWNFNFHALTDRYRGHPATPFYTICEAGNYRVVHLLLHSVSFTVQELNAVAYHDAKEIHYPLALAKPLAGDMTRPGTTEHALLLRMLKECDVSVLDEVDQSGNGLLDRLVVALPTRRALHNVIQASGCDGSRLTLRASTLDMLARSVETVSSGPEDEESQAGAIRAALYLDLRTAMETIAAIRIAARDMVHVALRQYNGFVVPLCTLVSEYTWPHDLEEWYATRDDTQGSTRALAFRVLSQSAVVRIHIDSHELECMSLTELVGTLKLEAEVQVGVPPSERSRCTLTYNGQALDPAKTLYDSGVDFDAHFELIRPS
jgi:hypothetical protein